MEPASLSQSTGRLLHRIPTRAVVSALGALLSGAALRFWMLHKFFEVNGDSQLYGSMAKNLLLHGRYAVNDAGGTAHLTLIRLPGYPLFLAACFRIFGMENYFAPACAQIVLELFGCLLLALFAARLSPPHRRVSATQATLWLACLCPFTAIYAAQPLTEAPTLFCIALALWATARFQDRPDWLSALSFTLAVTYAALLRPDGALVGVAFVPPIVHALTRAQIQAARRVRIGLVCVLLALAPFATWTCRNWRAFRVVQPLAPRYATDPGEPTWPGFQRWTKTWCLDFVSTYQIYWNMPANSLDINQLPARAFDSAAQREQTEKLFDAYEANGEELSPAIDRGFAQLAAERIADKPLRYYLWLPIGRVADMLFRPRVENLPIDLDWWVYGHHWAETRFSWFYAALNALYMLLALGGLLMRPRLWQWMVLYFLIRCALLATIEAPEARYTLEFFPMIFALAGLAISYLFAKRKRPERISPGPLRYDPS